MYESWFRFRRRPFTAAPRAEDYFPSEAAEHARKTTISCVQRAAGPALVIGSAGSGKTTACQQFLTHFRSRASVGLVACSGISSRRSFFQNILFEIGRPYRDLDDGELRLSLVDYLTSNDAPIEGTVLVFDDAHQLPTEQFEDLSMLSGLMRDGAHCVHLVLSGTVRLEELLSTPKFESLNQRVAARSYLEPFRIHETEAYVRRQFDRADVMADNIFVDGALASIHKCTSGTPRLINQLCDHALVLGAAGGHTRLNDRGVREAWSDLQHLPPPEDIRPQTPVEDVVEFGSLDDEFESVTPKNDVVGTTKDADEHVADEHEARISDNVEMRNADVDESDREDQDERYEASVTASFDSAENEPTKIVAKENDIESAPVERMTEDRLDEISEHLDDYQSLPYPSVDPFAEVFAEEEVVISRPSSMLNRLADRQPEVVSQFGQDMISALDQLSTDGGFLRASDSSEQQTDFDYERVPDEPRLSVTSYELESTSDEEYEAVEREPQEPLSHETDHGQQKVVDYAESGSYEIVVDFDAPDSGTRGAVDFQASVDEVTTAEPQVVSELIDVEPTVEFETIEEAVDSTADDQARKAMEQVVQLAMSTPTIRATNVADMVDLPEAPPREPQQSMSEVRVVELNSSGSESTTPRRRFKQLFSGLSER